MKSMPTPLGPYILCPDRLNKSIPMSTTSISEYKPCAASTWNTTPLSLQSLPIVTIGWLVPISLFVAIVEISNVSSVIKDFSFSTSTRPDLNTGAFKTLNPSFSVNRAEPSTHLCSISEIIIVRFLDFSKAFKAVPIIAALFDSVAPEVNIISSSREFISSAM